MVRLSDDLVHLDNDHHLAELETCCGVIFFFFFFQCRQAINQITQSFSSLGSPVLYSNLTPWSDLPPLLFVCFYVDLVTVLIWHGAILWIHSWYNVALLYLYMALWKSCCYFCKKCRIFDGCRWLLWLYYVKVVFQCWFDVQPSKPIEVTTQYAEVMIEVLCVSNIF